MFEFDLADLKPVFFFFSLFGSPVDKIVRRGDGSWNGGTLSNCELDKHQTASYASLSFVSVRF